MNPNPAFDIIAMGEAMVEFSQVGTGHDVAGPAQGAPAAVTSADTASPPPSQALYLQGFGGDTSNAVIAAARQGARVAYLSALGDDPYAQMLRALWDAEGVDHQGVVCNASAFTGVYFIHHDAGGHHFRFFRTGSAASAMTAASLPLQRIRSARALHLSGITLAISASACDAAYAAIRIAREAGVQVVFDTNLRRQLWSIDRARAVMNDVIGQCDICLPSHDDIVAITGITDPDALVDHCLQQGARIVALKLGERGALVADARQRHRIAPHPCQPRDASGAGDTFGGTFVHRLLQGDTLAQAGRYAAAAAALSTEGYGAVAPIPRAPAVWAALGIDPRQQP